MTKNDNAVINSRNLAELTGRRHADVLKTLRLIKNKNTNFNFNEDVYKGTKGKNVPLYTMSINDVKCFVDSYKKAGREELKIKLNDLYKSLMPKVSKVVDVPTKPIKKVKKKTIDERIAKDKPENWVDCSKPSPIFSLPNTYQDALRELADTIDINNDLLDTISVKHIADINKEPIINMSDKYHINMLEQMVHTSVTRTDMTNFLLRPVNKLEFIDVDIKYAYDTMIAIIENYNLNEHNKFKHEAYCMGDYSVSFDLRTKKNPTKVEQEIIRKQKVGASDRYHKCTYWYIINRMIHIRAGGKCEESGATTNLQVHHLDYTTCPRGKEYLRMDLLKLLSDDRHELKHRK